MRKRKDFKRREGVKSARLVVIAAEGRNTENIYFESMKVSLCASDVHVEVLHRDSNESSPENVYEQIRKFMSEYNIEDDDQLWIVVDKDKWKDKMLSAVAQYCAQIIKGGVNFIMSPAKQEQHQIFLKEALLLHNSLTLCRSLLDESQRYEAAFFEAVRTLLSRMTGKGKVSKREINARIGELLKHSIKSEGVINLFSDVKAEFSLFDAAFLDDISKMKEKNIAVELLKRLLAERVTLYQKTNIVQAEKFSDLLNRSLSNYLKGLLTNEEVIQELLKLAKEISSSEAAGNDLGLTREEKSFYDALTQPQAVHDVYTNEELVTMTKELTEILRKNRTIDWQKKESARAGMRKMIKRLLKKYHYPPEEAANALETVIRQCEQWTDNEMPVNEPKVYHLYESDYPMAAAERVEYNKK